MLQDPLFLIAVLFFIAIGVFYLIVTREAPVENEEETPSTWQVQCPQCNRWKTLKPLNNEELSDSELGFNQSIGTPHPRRRIFKCPFCGHAWQERYIE